MEVVPLDPSLMLEYGFECVQFKIWPNFKRNNHDAFVPETVSY